MSIESVDATTAWALVIAGGQLVIGAFGWLITRMIKSLTDQNVQLVESYDDLQKQLQRVMEIYVRREDYRDDRSAMQGQIIRLQQQIDDARRDNNRGTS